MDFLPANRPVAAVAQPGQFKTQMAGLTEMRVVTQTQDTAAPAPVGHLNDTTVDNTHKPGPVRTVASDVFEPGGGEMAMRSAIEAKMALDTMVTEAAAEMHAMKSQLDRWIKVLNDVMEQPGQPATLPTGTPQTIVEISSRSSGTPI